MAGTTADTDLQLHLISPEEQVGRDTIARYQAQYRATALECLKLLKVGCIDRVYCEFHDDFVTRRSEGGEFVYRFFQVKTVEKRNRQWSVVELFGIPKQKKVVKKAGKSKTKATVKASAPIADDSADHESTLPTEIAKSFVGKLLLHTVKFEDACEGVSFLTNASLHDDAETIAALILDGLSVTNPVLDKLIEHFNAAYGISPPHSVQEIKSHLTKLSFDPGLPHLSPHGGDYDALASAAIYKFSEIDLTQSESSRIAANLVLLVERKSFPKFKDIPGPAELDKLVGIQLADLLDLLSISSSGYLNLVNGGDEDALKNASIIQRKLVDAGANPSLIDLACSWKISWDNWFRTYRHLDEVDMATILEDIAKVQQRWSRGDIAFSGVRLEASKIMSDWASTPLGSLLSKELIVGGVFAELVRSESYRRGLL